MRGMYGWRILGRGLSSGPMMVFWTIVSFLTVWFSIVDHQWVPILALALVAVKGAIFPKRQ